MSTLHLVAAQGNETSAVCGTRLTPTTIWTRIAGWFSLLSYQPEKKRCRKCATLLAGSVSP